MSGRAWTFVGVVGVAVAGSFGGCSATPAPSGDVPGAPGRVSNILRADYVGSAACQPCHAELYERFVQSPMHRMTRIAATTDIEAPFAGDRFEHQGDVVILEKHEDRRYMRLSKKAGAEEEIFLVTKVIGGRYREDFVGYEVPGTDAGSARLAAGDTEYVLPVSWLRFDRSYRYKGYSVMVPERDRLQAGSTWSETCIFCHNTTPFVTTLYDELGVDTDKYQGSVSDQLLPAARTWSYRVDDETGLRDAVAAEIAHLGRGDRDEGLDEILPLAVKATRRHFRQDHLVEVGIGCEACHNGGRAHVEDPRVVPTFAIQSPLVSVDAPATAPATDAATINRTCARCHTVLFSRYEHTWEGARRSYAPGGSHINSGEARDFLLGGCQGEMSCADCHDPHGEPDSKPRLDAMGTVAGNETCTRCHGDFTREEARAKHTRHAPDSAGAACLVCHMPKKNMGLAYEMTRYHRIGSPTDEARVYGDRPLECALCHIDWSVERTVAEMERGWGKRFDRGRLGRLYADPSATVIAQTLRAGKAHEQVAAAGALGEHGQQDDALALVPLLVSTYPLVRYFAKHAIEELTGRRLEVDLFAAPAVVQGEAEAALGPP